MSRSDSGNILLASTGSRDFFSVAEEGEATSILMEMKNEITLNKITRDYLCDIILLSTAYNLQHFLLFFNMNFCNCFTLQSN